MNAQGAPEGVWSLHKSLFDQARAGLEVYDAGLRVLQVNPAMLMMRGLSSDMVVGAELADLDSGIPLSPLMHEVMETGTPVFDRPMTAERESRREYAVTGYPLREDGRSIGSASVIHDVTEEVRQRGELGLLHTARARIGNSLDAVRTTQELADVAVPRFADAVAVDLLESVLTGDAPVGPISDRLPMRRAAFKARDGQYGAYAVGSTSYVASPTPYTQALADLRPRLVDSMASAGAWMAYDRARAEFIARYGVQSLIVAPLTVHGLVLGLISFYREEGSRSRPFDEQDLSVAAQLAVCTSLCVDNARRFTREQAVATSLQRSLLPRRPPEVSAVESSHCYLPGRYGAHWFDVLPLSSCRVGLVIGYVPGQDLQAAAAMGRLRSAASTLASMDLPPDELLTHLDDAAQRLAREQDSAPVTLYQASPPFTASCLYVTYDPITGHCAAASAGHDSPLLTSPDGVVSTLEVPRGEPLGRGAPYDVVHTELPTGSVLSLFSDNSVGRYPGEADGRLGRLRDVVGDLDATPQQICDTIAYTVVQGTPLDGVALLVARTRSLDPDQISSWTFPPEALSVREARRAVRDQLAAWDLEEHVPVTDLVVSELATNVVRHAEGGIRLRLIRDRTLTVEVSDDADTAPHLRHARLQDEGGRGLFLVASLSQHWGTRYEATGKTIWAEQDLTGP